MNRTKLSAWSGFVFTCLIITSCANYKLNYSSEVKNWDQPLPDKPLSHTFYLIGDAGNSTDGKVAPALQLLAGELEGATENSSVIFLGDNLYPNGMAPKSKAPERADDEFRLRAQLDPVKNFPGNVYFIAGNHDWTTYGIAGLKRQRTFIEDYLDRKGVWQPDCGCGDPKEIDLSDDLVLILLDSGWWFSDWDGEAEINQQCEARSRETFKLLLEDALKSNREKIVIVAMHHSLYSKGPHGGAFTMKDHLFPLTKIHKSLWIPLPVLGSIYPLYRSSVGTPEDIVNAQYRAFRSFIMEVARKNGQYIFVSGHDHNLQYAEVDDQRFIISGAGSKNIAVSKGSGTQFSYGHQGFAELFVYQDGSVWVQYRAVADEAEASGKIVFRKKIKDVLPDKSRPVEFVQDQPLLQQQNITTQILDGVYDRKGLGKAFWGIHYRNAYQSEVVFPVLRLDEFQGGLQPVKTGGGYQTNSLRLEAPDGRQYTMRSIKKDPSRILGNSLSRSSFIRNLYLDAFNSAHPMAALPIPKMADAVGVYHTNPTIYYIPRQQALGIYNEDYGDDLYLVEERPDGDEWRDQASFGYPRDIVSTTDALQKITDDRNHLLDYPSIVRARLFDLVIGDWDRHDDQWRWARIERRDTVFYQPIPRDRDQAFSKYDGMIYGILREASAPARPLRAYAKNQKIHWSNYGCRYFDATFLAGAPWKTWEEQISHLQQNLTDEVVETAFRTSWPDTIYQLDGAEIMAILKARRDALKDLARSYYEFHAKRVVLTGTKKRDLFEIERRPDGTTRVAIYDTNRNEEKEGLWYDRLFKYPETGEIHLYGLDDDDVFHIRGEGGRGARIRLIGGLGHDVVKDFSADGRGGEKTILYDSMEEEVDLPDHSRLKVRLSDDPKYNTYNRLSKDFEYDYASFLPILGFNPDDGFLLGISPVFVNYGFNKSPFADRHTLGIQYALSTSGFQFTYRGEFIEALGKGNLTLDATMRTPLYTYNFYGLGNDTENLEDEKGIDYHRVRERYIAFAPTYSRQVQKVFSYGFGPTFESIRIALTGDRFIDEQQNILDPKVLDGMEFLGFQVNFKLENLNDPVFPTRGLKLSSKAGWVTSINNASRNFPYYEGTFTIYQQIDAGGKLVFATQLGGRHLFNNKFEFFQGATLGGLGPNGNFRGLHRERYTGRSAFYQNIDLRWKIIDSKNAFLPFSVGIFTGFDHGRIWVQEESSDTWHYSYGGGFWLSPLDLLDLKFSFFRADQGKMKMLFGGKFFF